MDILGALSQPNSDQSRAICSRKGCEQTASWQIVWNNPKVHSPERRKIWTSCIEHRIFLEDFVRSRQFWIETLPMD